MKKYFILILLSIISATTFSQDTIRVRQATLDSLQLLIRNHPETDTVRIQYLIDFAQLCFYDLDFLNGFKAAIEARIISKQIKYRKGEGLYLKTISIFRRRINAGNAFIKTQDINKMNEVNEFINNLDIYHEVEGNRVLGQYTDFDLFGNIDMPIGIRDSEIATIISKLEEALSYYAEKGNLEITAYLQDALSFIYFNSDKEKSKKHKKEAQGLYQELKWSYHQLLILVRDIDNLLEQGMEAAAKPLEIEAISIYTTEADKYIKAHCAYLLARTYGLHNRANLILEYLFQAEELLTEIGEKDLLKPVYISVATVYEWLLSNSEKALEYEHKELNLRKEINHFERVAHTYLLISESLFGLKRIQDFPPEYKEYLMVGGIKGSLFFDAEFLWVKARMLQAQGKSVEAQSVFQQSIATFMKYNDKNGASWAVLDLAESFKSVGDLKNAINYAQTSFDWASEINLLNRQVPASELLSQLYEQTGEKEKAFSYLKQYKVFKDKNDKLNNEAHRSELEMQSILKKRQREIELLESESQLKEQENKTQRVWLFSIAGALVSLVFLSFILIRNNRQKQKTNLVLNSKNKELEIETALERVRSASMAMHKSEDLINVATVMYDAIKNLGITQSAHCGFAIINEEKKLQELWGSQTDSNLLVHFILPLIGDQVFLDRYEAWKRKEPFFSQKLDAQQLKKHLEVAMPDAKITEEERRSKLDMPETTYFHFGNFTHGYLQITATEPLDKEQTSILVRFVKVFEQSYTRFLDLQKAEAQAREAQIEAALERVRSRSLAMHKSEELVDVATVLYKELRKLDVRDISEANIVIFDEDKNQQTIWTARTDFDSLEKSVFPLLGDQILQKIYDLWKRQETFFTVKVAGLELKKHCDFVYPIATRTELEAKFIASMPDPTYFHSACFSMGNLELMSDKELGDNSSLILTRFAKVFDQSYTRFLDLQKAEAQAREAQIEAALERVRARSMAMFKSEELADVVSLMYAQIQNLGFKDWACAIILCDEVAQIMRYWNAELNMSHSPEYFNVPLTNKTIREIWKLWKESIPQFTIELLNKDKDEFTEYMLTETDHKNLPDEVKHGWRSSENVFFSYTHIKYGLLEFTDIVPFVEENLLVYQRFAKVFEQTYTRFLDLQKAEAQAREAQIEAGLERVRSRSMAMHKSEELSELVTLVYDEIKPFGFATAGVELILMDEKNKLQQYWLSTAPETKIIECFNIPTSIHPHFQKQWKAWKDQIPRLSLTLEGPEKKAFDQLIFTQTDFKKLSEDVKEFILNHGSIDVFSHAIMKYGLLEAVDKIPLSEEKFVILERFAKVFEQTYTRFLDLQKAEAQAREAQIEAALERVRTQAMAMHKSDDLLNISKVLYEELKILGIDEIRNAMLLIHDEKNEFFLDYDYSSIGGKITRIPTNGISLIEKYVKELKENEKSKVSFLELIVSGEELESWKKARKATGQLDDPRLDSMEALYYYHYSIGTGNISISTFSTLSNEKLQVLERFRNVFQLPYQRYHDIEIAEAQSEQARLQLIQIQTEKKRAEDALTILKATQTQLIQSEKLASLGELTAGIAHEIQNPLNFVNNFSELNTELIEELKSEKLKVKNERSEAIENELIENIKDNELKINQHGQRASSIVKGMLEHSRKSSGVKSLTDINALCDEYLRLSYHGLRAKDKDFNADFELIADENLPKINIIPQDFGRVMLNLINNAFWAVNDKKIKPDNEDYKPKVTITTQLKTNNSLLITISDNGPGIPASIKDKIFQPFFTTKPTGQGTGLGLSLAYDIVKAHGGEIQVVSNENVGTEFIIQLPIL